MLEVEASSFVKTTCRVVVPIPADAIHGMTFSWSAQLYGSQATEAILVKVVTPAYDKEKEV